MPKLKLINGGDLEGKARIHPDDLKAFGFPNFSPVWIIDKDMDIKATCMAIEDKEVTVGEIKLDMNVFDSVGFDSGAMVELVEIKGAKSISEITWDVESENTTVLPNFEAVKKFGDPTIQKDLFGKIRHSFITSKFRFTYNLAGNKIKLKYNISEPMLGPEDAGTIEDDLISMSFKEVNQPFFNAILLLDISGSMKIEKDMLVKGETSAITQIKGMFSDPETEEFLKKFKPLENVSRMDAALFVILLFLVLKAGLGKGKQFQIIPFGDDATPLTIMDEKGAETSVFNMENADNKKTFLDAIKSDLLERANSDDKQSTWMSKALRVAAELVDKFQPYTDPVTGTKLTYPVSIVMFTDGFPAKGDDKDQLNPIPIISKLIAPRSDVVLYIIGVGEANDEQLRSMAELAKGEYIRPVDMDELIKIYNRLAQEIVVKTTKLKP